MAFCVDFSSVSDTSGVADFMYRCECVSVCVGIFLRGIFQGKLESQEIHCTIDMIILNECLLERVKGTSVRGYIVNCRRI